MRWKNQPEITRYEDGRRGVSWRAGLAVALLVLLGAPQAGRSEEAARIPDPAATALEPAVSPRPSWGKRLLFYAPNRVMDLLDIFRLRLRLGPGLAVNLRMTDYGAFYIGTYDAVYLGLPGPRSPHRLRLPVGMESLRGVVLAGVDATDDTRHGPEYGAAETDVGVQLLLVGAEAGFDATELVDFLGGLLFFDPRDDDYPRAAPVLPETTSGISLGAGTGVFRVEPKPDTFDSIAARMDYLHLNVQHRISEPLRATDAHFAVDPDAPIVPPQTQFRLGLYAILRQGKGFELKMTPDLEMDVELPNLEQKLRVFVESARANNLPQTPMAEQDQDGINVGARKFYKKRSLSFDAGMRAQWLPEAFARVTWKRSWNVGRLDVSPELRAFYGTDDKEGALASLFLNCWFGDSNEGLLIQDDSAKWTAKADTLQWGSSLSLARVLALLDETQRGHSVNWYDMARAYGIKYTVYGSYGDVDAHRLVFGCRKPLYKKWIYMEVDPGLEWTREEDYDTAFVVQVGLDMLFWGRAYE